MGLLMLPLFLSAQDNDPTVGDKTNVDRLVIPFSNEEEPKSLDVHLINGGVTVVGYEGAEVVVEAQSRKNGGRMTPTKDRGGLRPIVVNATGLYAEEHNNLVKVGLEKMNENADLLIKVPYETNLKLECINNGNIVVEGIKGEMNVNNINGDVTMKEVSGVVVAHALNGRVSVTLKEIVAEKNMSFTSMNGDIDVTLPQDTKAELKMETVNGQIFSDFEITMTPRSREPIVEDRRNEDGRYRLKFEKAVYGTINGGGPVFYFNSHNGEIMIRKGSE
jgi:DUF4097 and DUF4098 domain-containing protein YvlB